MKRLPLTLICSVGLLTAAGCANKDKSSTDPSSAAAGEGDGTSDENRPYRASSSTTTRGGEGKTKGRLKTFEAPEPVRTAVIVPGAMDGPSTLTVAEVRPSMAAQGAVVEIFGSGFGDDPAAIKVKSGAASWTVTEIYSDRIVAVVGAGGGTAAVDVAVGKGAGSTSNEFVQLGGDESFERPSKDLHGLIGSVYKNGGEKIPDFSGIGKPLGTIGLSALDISARPASDFEIGITEYAIRFEGSLNVDEEGEYELCLETDDRSRLLIMETLVVDNTVDDDNSGCELVYLEAGEYDIAVEYQNMSSTADVTMMLAWSFDGGAKGPIPSSALFRP